MPPPADHIAIGLIGAGVLPIGTIRPIYRFARSLLHARRLWARIHLAALHSFHRQPADLRSAFYELQPDHVIPGGALCNLQSACKIG